MRPIILLVEISYYLSQHSTDILSWQLSVWDNPGKDNARSQDFFILAKKDHLTPIQIYTNKQVVETRG
ncbi:MAG: hypothetical protein Q4A61_01995 [Porphyromonadaceae bacterium]|nr:hypothetical protein [Porphyromonadaceae bacterium]